MTPHGDSNFVKSLCIMGCLSNCYAPIDRWNSYSC